MNKLSIDDIVSRFYLLPVILDHFDNPTEESEKIIKEAGITDLSTLYRQRSLLQYHLYYISTRNENYPLLREGLDQYFDEHLSDVFKNIGLKGHVAYMLDYGAGDGKYAKQFMIDNPYSQVLCVDRYQINNLPKGVKSIGVDFEKVPDWYHSWRNTFNVVFMSELMHCKDEKGQKYLIDTSYAMLQENGLLIIHENMDYEMQWRISKIKGKSMPIVNKATIDKFIHMKFVFKEQRTINQHTAYVYAKIQNVS